MPIQMTFLKRILLPVTILLLVIVCVFERLTDIAIVDLSSGFSHPLEGWDHFVTMLAVGIWAAQLRGKAIWLLPATFVSVMSLGGISGAAKYLAVPSAEVLILLSCLVFSILIIQKIRFDTKINVLIVAFFAFFHGYAHGQEISASASLISYTLGFMIATLLLHGAGILVAKIIFFSMTFFIAQALNTVVPTETVKTVTVIYEKSDLLQFENGDIRKALSINLPERLNLSPPSKPLLHFFLWIKAYFVLSTLLFIFNISQFFCYVFYPEKHGDSYFFLACYFEKSFYLLTLSAFPVSYFNSHKLHFPAVIFVRPKFFNF